MQKTDEIEAANEAISVSFLQLVRRVKSDTKGYLKQQMSDWGDGQLQLVRWMGLGPGSMPGSINSARDVCKALNDVLSLQKSRKNGRNQQSPKLQL